MATTTPAGGSERVETRADGTRLSSWRSLSRCVAGEVERVFLADFAGSRRMTSQDVTRHPFWFRALAPVR
jgi:hypothetical protein